MSVKLGRRRIIQVKLEAAKGTALEGDTHVLVYDPIINPEDTFQTRQPSGRSAGNAPGVVGEHKGKCTFKTELRSDGVNALNAGLEILLQCCGMKLAASVYKPCTAVTDQKTCTIDVYEDGLMKRLYGAMGTYNIAGEYGKQVFLELDFSGIWSAPTDVALPTPALAAQLPIRMASGVFTIGAETPKISTFGLNPNNEVVQREDITTASALAHYLVAGRDPQVTMDMEAESVADHDAYGLWLAGTEAALSLLLTDGTVNVTIAAPKVQYKQVAAGDRDGKLTHDLTGQCNTNADAGDDDFSITTAAVV